MKDTILFCDDDKGILEVGKIILEESGFKVISVIDAKDILNTVAKVKPRVILLDYWMPNLDVKKLTSNLNKSNKKIPVIIVSASNITKQLTEEIGASDFIAKPFDIDVLVNKVQQYLH